MLVVMVNGKASLATCRDIHVGEKCYFSLVCTSKKATKILK